MGEKDRQMAEKEIGGKAGAAPKAGGAGAPGPKREFSGGAVQWMWLWMEAQVSRLTTPAYNPFYFLGAIGVFFLWVILVSGIYLFLFYSISVKGAWLSVQNLTVNQWYLGGVMRSLHRYASDGLVLVMLLHAIRCYMLDRHAHWRWVAWVSGIGIAWVIVTAGIFGYWMVWDQRAQLIATLSAHMLENVPIFGIPLSLNFARAEHLTDQFFYIILFIHFSSIFFLFILMLVHIVRITRAVINPPRALAYAVMAVLFAASFIKPATSAPPAELGRLVEAVPFDWFYMFIYPLLGYMSAHQLWAFIVAATLIAAAVPWLTRSRSGPAVRLTLENCTGCELCMEDCPYQAVYMRKRTDGMPYPLEAVIVPERCASCGICMGSCDYKALDLPDMTEADVKARIRDLSKELKESGEGPGVLVFACAKSAKIEHADGGRLKGRAWAGVVTLPCIGMLQPSMLSIPFEKSIGLDGVFVSSCRKGDCQYRKGDEWFTGRLHGYRPPLVRKSIDRSRVRTVYLSSAESGEFLRGLDEFRSSLADRRK